MNLCRQSAVCFLIHCLSWLFFQGGSVLWPRHILITSSEILFLNTASWALGLQRMNLGEESTSIQATTPSCYQQLLSEQSSTLRLMSTVNSLNRWSSHPTNVEKLNMGPLSLLYTYPAGSCWGKSTQMYRHIVFFHLKNLYISLVISLSYFPCRGPKYATFHKNYLELKVFENQQIQEEIFF